MLIVFVNCDNDNGLSGPLVNGTIGGETWEYQFAKANYLSSTDEFAVEMFGQLEMETDPCVIVSINAYISFTISNEEGYYPLPLSEGTKNLKFHQSGVGQQFLDATSGFIEITSIEGRRVGGYIQAIVDDENTIEGTFAFDRCI